MFQWNEDYFLLKNHLVHQVLAVDILVQWLTHSPFPSVDDTCQEQAPPGRLDEGRDLDGRPHVERRGAHDEEDVPRPSPPERKHFRSCQSGKSAATSIDSK